MPLYEFHCDDCASDIELLVRRSDESVTCPLCGGTRLHRLVSAPAAPASSSRGLPMTRPMASEAQSCGMPRCCGGGCQLPD
jgi:putative FmdB family regulatory protein